VGVCSGNSWLIFFLFRAWNLQILKMSENLMTADLLNLQVGAIFKNRTLDIVGEANRWLEAGKEECLDPMAWTTEGPVIFPGKLPVHLYAAHIIRQSSSLRR
jgi:hypothetical protein